MHALAAEGARLDGDLPRALESYDQAFQIDPGVFLRMQLTVPVRIVARGGDIADEIADLVAGSPRFDVEDVGMRVEIQADAQRSHACLIGASGSVLSCSDEERRSAEPQDDWISRATTAFHQAAFAPRVDLSQADANSLDGSNTVSRQPLDALFGAPEDADQPMLLDPP